MKRIPVESIKPSKLLASEVRRFRATVFRFFERQGRYLPWRRDNDPYAIFVSEIMLQQTQVDRVEPKFELFIRELPDFPALAGAPLNRVLALWQGLGYNRRALALKRAAEIVTRDHGGVLPSSPDILVTLPGIGAATAASIAAFAFNKPTLFLETNIRTVLIHHFFKGKESVSDSELLPVALAVLDRTNPRRWYSALMDYGTVLKKEHGNASRRSAHYKKQSRFEGSRRQVRGKIIRVLLGKKSLTAKDVAELSDGVSVSLVEEILGELTKENIILKRKNRYSIAS
jgi:A/G-specific adenine glycosylase